MRTFHVCLGAVAPATDEESYLQLLQPAEALGKLPTVHLQSDVRRT